MPRRRRRLIGLLVTLAGGCGGGEHARCIADFPCGGRRYVCAGPNAYQEAVDLDCHAICGPGPCSGATCGGRGPQLACPAGTTCVSPPPLTDASAPPCAPSDAGADGPRLPTPVPAHASAVDPADSPGPDHMP